MRTRRTTRPRSRSPGADRSARDAEGPQRLQKLLAASGSCSRREAERWILEGRVSVNGRIVRELGSRADPRVDVVLLDGRRVSPKRGFTTYVLHKPRGVVTTTRDPHAGRAAVDLVPGRERVFPVGRLDARSEGVLLLTDDGALAFVLTHPSFEVPRTYRVTVEGALDPTTVERLRGGVEVGGRAAVPRSVRVVSRSPGRTALEITLCEGRKRQIREMMKAVGHPVRRLIRTRFGPVRLAGLPPGQWRPLRGDERRALEALVRRAQETR